MRAARATDPVAHAHWIVLTENAVGFENGGQRVPPDGKTNTLYVSRAGGAANDGVARHPRETSSFSRVRRRHLLHSPTPACARAVRVGVGGNMGAFPGFVTGLTVRFGRGSDFFRPKKTTTTTNKQKKKNPKI